MSQDRQADALERIASALEQLAGGQAPAAATAVDLTPDPLPDEQDNAHPSLDDLRTAVKQAAAVDRAQTVATLKRYNASKAPEVAEWDYKAVIADLDKVTNDAG